MGEARDKSHTLVSSVSVSMNCKVTIDYTNYRGERAKRTVVPHNIFHGSTEYHTNPQWLLSAWDCEKHALRIFAMQDIHSFHNESVNDGARPATTLRIDVVASSAGQGDHVLVERRSQNRDHS